MLASAKTRIGGLPLVGGLTRRGYRHLHAVLRPKASAVTRANSRRAYEKLYRSDRLLSQYLDPVRLGFYDEVASIAAKYAPATVIDVGCGTGELLRALADRLDGRRQYVGVDHARSGIERARGRFPDALWLHADLFGFEHALEGQRFELVLCTEVLEHVREPGTTLRVLTRLAAPGGHVLVTVPDGAIDDYAGHVNFWDERAFRELLAPYGLRDVRRVEDGHVLLGILAVARPPCAS